jgi:hypothetical protein
VHRLDLHGGGQLHRRRQLPDADDVELLAVRLRHERLQDQLQLER